MAGGEFSGTLEKFEYSAEVEFPGLLGREDEYGDTGYILNLIPESVRSQIKSVGKFLSGEKTPIESIEAEDYIPALAYVFQDREGLFEGIGKKEIVNEFSSLDSIDDLNVLLEKAEREGLVEESGQKYGITGRGGMLVEEGFEFSEKELEYRETDWTELHGRLEEEYEIIKLEVVTVNEENSILKGGFYLDKGRWDGIEEGDELVVMKTGETRNYDNFDVVEIVEDESEITESEKF